LSLELSALDVREVIEAAVNVVRPGAAAKQITIETRCGSVPALVRGDSGRLQQVVWNLLANAIKFTPAGGRVTVELASERESVEIAVADTGVGIAPEFVPHVFDRFRQADASSTRGHGGLGLGLSIVRSLVELHGGNVRVESNGVGAGASFKVTLPRVDASLDAVPAAAHGADTPTRDSLGGLTVLVVDDDRDGRELAAEVLQQHGARVIESSSAVEALAAVDEAATALDLVISDIGMPGMDGLDFIRELRASAPRYATLPAIALTAYAGARDRARTLAAGYHVHLSKPYSPGALVTACASLIESSRRS
jgi:CheY-like chemotaxis protein